MIGIVIKLNALYDANVSKAFSRMLSSMALRMYLYEKDLSVNDAAIGKTEDNTGWIAKTETKEAISLNFKAIITSLENSITLDDLEKFRNKVVHEVVISNILCRHPDRKYSEVVEVFSETSHSVKPEFKNDYEDELQLTGKSIIKLFEDVFSFDSSRISVNVIDRNVN